MQFLIDIGLTLIYFCIFCMLMVWTFRFWLMYVQQKGLNSLNWVLLEIKLPREINKSPLATEMALASLLQGGGIGNKFSRLYKGALPAFSSLEIASLEGVIHFYIRTQKKFRPLVEANFYAQYPGIEIVEAEDYTSRIQYHHHKKDVAIWGSNYMTGKKWKPIDPKTGKPYSVKENGKKKDYEMKADFLPIKTYVDYGLDKNDKEEHKIDPLSTILEIMASAGKGEYYWYQLLIQDEGVYNGDKMPKFYVNEETHDHISLKDMADARKKQIRTSGYIIHGDTVYDDYGEERKRKKEGSENETEVITYKVKEDKDGNRFAKPISKAENALTEEEKGELELINRKLSKPLALCMMRFVYVAKSEHARVGDAVQQVLSLTKPFAGANANSLGPSGVTHPYDYDWQDIGKKRSSWRSEEKFEEYVEREGFYPHIPERTQLTEWEDMFFWPLTMKQRKLFRMMYEAIFHPFDHPHAEAFVLNLEEVATLWHLPGATALTPTLPRIDSTKGVAPSNLPI